MASDSDRRPSGDPVAGRRAISFTAGGLEFGAVIDVPPRAHPARWGILLIGGGLGNDLDWSTPGSITVEGQTTQMTTSGEPHADAPLISAALTELGFVVMRWSTIARGDPLADQWPLRATPRAPEDLMAQALAALAALRDSGLVDRDRIMLIGHSLGAARACTIASDDQGIKALVLLSPAYFVRSETTPRSFIESGMKHGADVLRDRPMPCLILLGGSDGSRAVNAGAICAWAGTFDDPRLEVRVFDGLGHQLGVVRGQQTGPIDKAVLRGIADWSNRITREE